MTELKCELAVKFIKDYERLANKLLEHSDFVDNLKNHNFVDNMLLIREIILESKQMKK